MSKIKEALLMEREMAEIIDGIKEQIVSGVSTECMDGVVPVSDKPNVVTVNIKSIDRTILDPSYYIQHAQADIVNRKLKTANTTTQLIGYIKDMVSDGKIKCGSETVRLNPKTLSVLSSFLKEVDVQKNFKRLTGVGLFFIFF